MVVTMVKQNGYPEKRSCKAIEFSGLASTRDEDSYKSIIINPDFSRWQLNPVIKRMHDGDIAVGIGRSIAVAENGDVRLTGLILDPDTCDKVSRKLLRGLSIGFDDKVSYVRPDGVRVYVRPVIAEVSVCLLPSNARCTIDSVTCASQE